MNREAADEREGVWETALGVTENSIAPAGVSENTAKWVCQIYRHTIRYITCNAMSFISISCIRPSSQRLSRLGSRAAMRLRFCQ